MRIKNKRMNAGFTLVELLIAMVLMAMLAAALATALDAGTTNYIENEKIFRAMNMARQSLFIMTSQIRSAGSVDNDPNLSSNICSFTSADGTDMSYEYRPSFESLYLVNNTTGDENILCSNISSMSFDKSENTVNIDMTVTVGGVSQSAASSAVVRRKLIQ
jgi:prepilin-type N-terminal cleavage/methylation domain-containing protein